MKKQTKTLIILLVVLVLLAAGIFVVKALTKEPETEVEAAEDYTVLFKADISEVTEFSYTSEGEKLTFRSTEKGWVNADHPDMPLDTEKLASMLAALLEVRSYKQIDTQEDFGFAENAIELSVKTADQAFYCTIGNKNTIIDKVYLMTDDGTVCTTDPTMRSEFTGTLSSLLLADSMPEIDTANITNISVKNGEAQFDISKYDERELYYWFSYILENDKGKTPLDTTAMDTYLTGVMSPYLTCEDYAPTAEEVSAAGFDDPAVLTITYSETDEEENVQTKTYQLLFGATFADDNSNADRRYMMLEDSEMLFSVAAAAADQLISPVLSELAPSYLAQMDFYELSEFSFSINGKSHTVQMKKVEDEKTYTLDGEPINGAFTESFFLDLTLMTSEGGYVEELPTEPVVSAAFTQIRDDGEHKYMLNIYEYNENFCIAEFTGRQDIMLVSIRDYNKLYDSYAELMKNAER